MDSESIAHEAEGRMGYWHGAIDTGQNCSAGLTFWYTNLKQAK